jgi:predicted dehydrogenase
MSNTDHPKDTSASRREFLKKGALAASAIVSGVGAETASGVTRTQYKAPMAKSSVLGAADRLRVGFVGVGGQGFNAHVRTIANMDGNGNPSHEFDYNAVGVAACDLYTGNRERAGALLEDARSSRGLGDYKVEMYKDHREMMDRDDIDVIFIGTVDHWHAQVAIDAMESGKHVYCEKPMTRYLPEAFDVYDAVKRTGMKFQVGSQFCTEGKWHVANEMIKAGKIGPLVTLQNSYTRNTPTGEWNYYEMKEDVTPDTLDWDHWLGKVHDRSEFNVEHWARWRKFLPYCAGILGDLLAHRIHPLIIAAGAEEFPKRVACLGNHNITLAQLGPDDRSVTDNTQLLAEYPSGHSIVVLGSTVNEQGLPQVIRGQEATLYFGDGTIELRPERPFADLVDQELIENITPGPTIPAHVDNLLSSIRNDVAPNGNIDVAIRAQTMISMAEMSQRLGEMVYFDEKTRGMSTGSGKKLDTLSYGTLSPS